MKSLVFALVCLVAAPCMAADWNWAIAQAPPAVSAAACPCGESCPCGDSAAELASLRSYHSRMESWLTRQGHRTVSTSRVVQSATPVVMSQPTVSYRYASEEPVCVDGQCYLPSQAAYSNRSSMYYTGGRYTSWIPRGGFLRGGRVFGGSCANGQCQ